MGKRLITQTEVRKAAEAGHRTIDAPPGTCIVTPMARDEAEALGISFGEGGSIPAASPEKGTGKGPSPSEAVAAQVSAIMRERLPAGVQPAQLERMVREAVVARLTASASVTPEERPGVETHGDGVRMIDSRRLLQGRNRPVDTAGKAMVAEAVGLDPEERLAGGYMRWERTSFSRTVDRPEVGIVIEGELHVTVGGKTMIAKPGDMIYLPTGTAAVYAAPASVLLACVSGKP